MFLTFSRCQYLKKWGYSSIDCHIIATNCDIIGIRVPKCIFFMLSSLLNGRDEATDASQEFPITPRKNLILYFPLCFRLISFYLPSSLFDCHCCFDNCKHIVPFFTQKSPKCFSNVSSISTKFNPNSLLSF